MTTAADLDEPRRDRWERVMDWPLTGAAVVFLVAYAWPILDPARGRGTSGAVLRTLSLVTWVLFVVDYVARLVLSRRRARFVRHNLLDLAVVVLPMFRPLRLLRLVKVLGVMNHNAGASLRGRVAAYVGAGSVLVVLVSALAALAAERGHPGATITTYGQALWWAVTTVSTVGYGDVYPVTVEGRLVATGLMVAGIGLLGVVTASFASWLLERVSTIEESSRAATRRDVRELAEEVAALRGLLESQRAGGAGGAAG